MKVIAFLLTALVTSMVVGVPVTFADPKLDSLVNIATKARAQVKFELDRSQNTTDEIKELFEQGSQQTDLLISAAEDGKIADAKRYFVAAMKIFKEVTIRLSQPYQEVTPRAENTPATKINYKNDIDRTEKYVGMLKNLVEKNNFTVEFSRVDGLIQKARESLDKNDISSLEKTYGELRSALSDIQNAIQQQTEQRQNDRARSFADGYIAKIDAILAQSEKMGLSEEEIARLVKAKEELRSISDPNLLIIKIRQYSVTISQTTHDAKQRIVTAVSQLEKKLDTLEAYIDDNTQPKFEEARKVLGQLKDQPTSETTKLLEQLDSIIKEIENDIRLAEREKQTESKLQIERSEQKQETQKEDSKRVSAEVLKLEKRLEGVKPYVDENISSKFESAQILLNKLLNGETSSVAEYDKTIRILDFLIDSMEKYIESLQKDDNRNNSKEDLRVNQEKIRPSEKENRGSEKSN